MAPYVRGTPPHIKPSLLRLALVVAAVFLAFPLLSAFLFRSIQGAENFPFSFVITLLLSGAASWAVASFTASSAWLSLGLGISITIALFKISRLGFDVGTSEPTFILLSTSAPLIVAGCLGSTVFTSVDWVVILSILGGGASRTEFLKDALSIEVQCLVVLVIFTLLTSPGLIGHTVSRAFSPLSTDYIQIPAAIVSLAVVIAQPSIPTALVALLSFLLLASRALSHPPEPTFHTKQNARTSHWLLAGLLTSFSVLTLENENLQGQPSNPGLVALLLILAGASIAVIVTSFSSTTARVWAPVRSGEYQMVTLDFLALLTYFVGPLIFVWYLGFQQIGPYLPTPPALLVNKFTDLQFLLAPIFIPNSPLPQAAALAMLLVATQEAFEESSILWAHWLVDTFTLGALDTKHVALIIRLEPLLNAAPSPATLPTILKDIGIKLNIFVSPEVAAAEPEVIQALVDEGHVLGVETSAGPFTLPLYAAAQVNQCVKTLKQCGVEAPAWYLGTGGHRNPWALWRASTLHLRFIAPQLRVVLGDNAGVSLRRLLDPWCHGGIVFVGIGNIGRGRGNAYVDLVAALKDLKEQSEAGEYVIDGLESVCPEVKRMVLNNDQIGVGR